MSNQQRSVPERRSKCPLNIALETFGDRWTLLVIRDLIFKRFTTFKQFQQSNEGIATNILASRLKRLVQEGFVIAKRSAGDRRVVHYRPTQKALDLMPVMIAMMTWTDAYEKHSVPRKKMQEMVHHTDEMIADVVSQLEDASVEA